jgi:hypothetical protein
VTDTNVFQLSQPGTFTDPLTEVLRTGADTNYVISTTGKRNTKCDCAQFFTT